VKASDTEAAKEFCTSALRYVKPEADITAPLNGSELFRIGAFAVIKTVDTPKPHVRLAGNDARSDFPAASQSHRLITAAEPRSDIEAGADGNPPYV
jgi:hypothetical protein